MKKAPQPWLDEARRMSVASAAQALGLEVLPFGKSLRPCPACGAQRRGRHDPRGPVGFAPGMVGWFCFRPDCGAKGDALDLVAHALARSKFSEALRSHGEELRLFFADHGYGPIPGGGTGGAPRHLVRDRPQTRPPPQPTPAPRRPRLEDIEAIWEQCLPVTQDPEVVAWLHSRGLNTPWIADLDLARALPPSPPDGIPAWARFRGESWARTGHRLLLPLFDERGQVASIRARWVRPEAPPPGVPKGLAAAGFDLRGLVLACPAAGSLLAGSAGLAGRVGHGWPAIPLVISEGEPDFLTWASRNSDGDEEAPAVLGIVAGSWTEALAQRIPLGTTVVLRTDFDDAGDRYALQIFKSLRERCRVLRSVPPTPLGQTALPHSASPPPPPPVTTLSPDPEASSSSLPSPPSTP